MTAPLNEGTQLRQKIEERMGIPPKFYVYIKDPLNNIDTVMQLIATAERAAQAEGANKIITIFHNNHTISDAAYADMATTIASWRLAELSGEETTDNG